MSIHVASGRHDRCELPRRAHQLGCRPLPVARVEAQDEIRVAEHLLGVAHVERVPRREVQAAVDVVDRDACGLGQLHERMEAVGLAADVFGDDHRLPGGGDELGGFDQRPRIGRDARGHPGDAWRRQRHLAVERLLLQPGVVAHVDRSPRLGHHHRVGARERLGDAVDRVRLVVPLRVGAHRLALVPARCGSSRCAGGAWSRPSARWRR